MRKSFLLLLFCLTVLLAPPIQATPQQFIIGVEDLNFSPFYATQKKSPHYHGFAKDLLDLFAKDSNYRFSYTPLPVKRLFRRFIKKQVDFKFPDSKLWNTRQKKSFNIAYSHPVVTIRGAVMSYPKNVGIQKTPYVMGTILGFTPWQFTQKIKTGKIKLHFVPTAENLLNIVLKGRIDGAFTELSVSRHYLKKMGKEGALIPDQSMLKVIPETYHLSSIKYPEIIQKFNHFLKKKKKAIKALKHRYDII